MAMETSGCDSSDSFQCKTESADATLSTWTYSSVFEYLLFLRNAGMGTNANRQI